MCVDCQIISLGSIQMPMNGSPEFAYGVAAGV